MSDDRPRLFPDSSAQATRYPFSRDRLFLTCGLASALLFWAAFDNSHSDGFYTFLRIYVCGLSVLWAILFWILQRPAWSLAAICSAILFNPIFEIHFDESDWMIIDFVAGAAFGWIALQPYALFKSRPLVPYLPAIIMSAIAFLGTVNLRSPNMAAENTMNVDETLTTENVVDGDTTAIDAMPSSEINPFADLIPGDQTDSMSAHENMAEPPEPSEADRARVDYSQDWLNTWPNGSAPTAPNSSNSNAAANSKWLDEVLRRAPRTPSANDAPLENESSAVNANLSTDQ